MSFEATVYRVLIASPGDLGEERDVVQDVVYDWNATHSVSDRMVLLPVRWETHSVPEYGGRPQAILNRRLVADCDILIGAFWTRLGTPTGEFDSGTIEEIHEFTRSGKPVLMYFSSRHVDLDRVDLDQVQRVRAFRAQFERIALVDKFSDPGELRYKLTRHLHEHVRRLHRSAGLREVMDLAEQTRPPLPTVAKPASNRAASLDAAALDELYLSYWTEFANEMRGASIQLRAPAPSSRNYARVSLASSHMRLNVFASVRDRFIGVELILKKPACDAAFSRLVSAREKIEEELGYTLEWKHPPRSYRIAFVDRNYDPGKRQDWARQHAYLIEKLKEFQQSLLNRIEIR